MKTVIVNESNTNSILSSEIEDLMNNVIVAVADTGDKYLLVYEDNAVGKGFIFRDVVSPRYGHTGHSHSIAHAIKKAFELNGTKVYQFSFAKSN